MESTEINLKEKLVKAIESFFEPSTCQFQFLSNPQINKFNEYALQLHNQLVSEINNVNDNTWKEYRLNFLNSIVNIDKKINDKNLKI
jgi:hypothetical protein